MKNVLIVDDSKFSRKRIREILEVLGYKVVAEAADGNEGIEMCKEYKPNLIVTDLEMPNMDGISMIKEIRSYNNNMTIVVASSLINAQIVSELVKLNVPIVKKPVKESRLLTAIELTS